MILNAGMSGGGGLQVIASGTRTIGRQETNLEFEKPAAIVFVVELYRNGTPCSICFPSGTTITSEFDTKFSLSVDGKTLNITPQGSTSSFDMEYLALG